MDLAVVGLIGVVVGAVLAAGFGAWRDHQQRAHQLRAELRTERLAAITALRAAVERHFRLQVRRAQLEHHMDTEPNDEATLSQYVVFMPEWLEGDREVGEAFSRVSLLSPDLQLRAHEYVNSYMHISWTLERQERQEQIDKHSAAIRAFEEAPRKSLGIDG